MQALFHLPNIQEKIINFDGREQFKNFQDVEKSKDIDLIEKSKLKKS